LTDQERRKRGIPRVDTHVYAREKRLANRGVGFSFEVNGEAKTLDQATRAAQWITQHRALSGGGFPSTAPKMSVAFPG